MAAHALPDCAGCRSVCGASQVAVCEAVAGWVYVSDSFASSTCYSLPRCRCRLGDGGMESDGYNGDDFTAKARSSSPGGACLPGITHSWQSYDTDSHQHLLPGLEDHGAKPKRRQKAW